MLRKICNYLAVIALSLLVGGNAVFANSSTVKGKTENKKIFVDDNKDFSFYNEFIRGNGKHSYTVKVGAGEEVKIKLHSSKSVALKIQSPDGQTQNNAAQRHFEVKLGSEGVYVIEFESLYLSQYSLEISNN
jgi:hypothetical protein